MKITAATCVKNEGPFLLEWVVFHRLIGVTDFLIWFNDCDDGTEDLLAALAPLGVVALPNPATGRAYQMEALRAAARHPLVTGADWVWVADVDEFPNIHAKGHRLPDLIAACGTPDAISLCFQFFANGGIDTFEDAPVISQFTRSQNPDLTGGSVLAEVKTLTRKGFPLQYFGAHRPFVARAAEDLRWTDGSGRPVPAGFVAARDKEMKRQIPAQGARRFATLNHYALRSLDSYLVKIDRGDVNRENRAFDAGYWRDRNDGAWEDRSIQRYLPALRAQMARCRTVPAIARAHDACVAAHRARIAALRAQPGTAGIVAALKAAPPMTEAETALRKRLGYAA